MPLGEIEEGKQYHCREEQSGKNLTGIFCAEPTRISTRLISYQERPRLDVEKHLVIRTENNLIVSLHNNIASQPNSSFHRGLVSYSINVTTNRAIVGSRAWLPTDHVRKIQFRIEHARDSLYHAGKQNGISRSEVGDADSKIFSTRIADAEITAWYTYTLPTMSEVPTNIEPLICIEFDQSVCLDEARIRAHGVVKFFSALTGHYLRASEISISRYSSEEEHEAMEKREFKGVYQLLELRSRSDSTTENEVWVGHQFAHCGDDDELAALVACLKAWMNRGETWRKATNLMMESLSLDRNMIGANRLLTAAKWLEEIPGARSLPAMKPADVDVIAQRVSENAKEMGYGEIARRISGAIKSISKETRSEQFSRLLGTIRASLGSSVIDAQILSFLEMASRYRGSAAHGQIDAKSDQEFSQLCKATYALECFCYLLTIKDLPILPAGKVRLGRHPIVQDYLRSFLANES